MADTTAIFNAQVDAFVRKTEQRLTAVFREASKRVVSKAQSRIPVDTGFARASIRASLQAMPRIEPLSHGAPAARYPDTTPAVVLVIAGAEIKDTIYVGWTANYVSFLENGHSKQAPTGFVAISAQEWPTIVNQVAAELKGRIGG